jgi:hypothetical protein
VVSLFEASGIRTARQVKVEIEGQTDGTPGSLNTAMLTEHREAFQAAVSHSLIWSSDIFYSGFIGTLD